MTYQWGEAALSGVGVLMGADKPSDADVEFTVQLQIGPGGGPWTDQLYTDLVSLIQTTLVADGWTVTTQQTLAGSRMLEEADDVG